MELKDLIGKHELWGVDIGRADPVGFVAMAGSEIVDPYKD